MQLRYTGMAPASYPGLPIGTVQPGEIVEADTATVTRLAGHPFVPVVMPEPAPAPPPALDPVAADEFHKTVTVEEDALGITPGEAEEIVAPAASTAASAVTEPMPDVSAPTHEEEAF